MIVPAWLAAALVSVTLAAAGQILLKLGVRDALPPGTALTPLHLIGALRHPFVCLGVTAFAASTVVWLAAISGQELSRVYPIAAVGYVLVTVVSVWLFHDTLSLAKVAGIGLIVLGIVVLNSGSPATVGAPARPALEPR